MKKVPSFWWDFEGDSEVIVESDSAKYPVVARFSYDPVKGGRPATGEERKILGVGYRVGQAEDAIEKAEKFISDLNAGRVTPVSC